MKRCLARCHRGASCQRLAGSFARALRMTNLSGLSSRLRADCKSEAESLFTRHQAFHSMCEMMATMHSGPWSIPSPISKSAAKAPNGQSLRLDPGHIPANAPSRVLQRTSILHVVPGTKPLLPARVGTAGALNLLREIDTPSGIWQSGIFGARLPMMDHLLASPATQFVRANREALPS